MCFRIKLVQQFLTMMSQKLSPNNLFGWSGTSETRVMERQRTYSEPQPKQLRKHRPLRGRAGFAGTCCPLAALGVSASPEPGLSHTFFQGKQTRNNSKAPTMRQSPPGCTSLHSERTLELRTMEVSL